MCLMPTILTKCDEHSLPPECTSTCILQADSYAKLPVACTLQTLQHILIACCICDSVFWAFRYMLWQQLQQHNKSRYQQLAQHPPLPHQLLPLGMVQQPPVHHTSLLLAPTQVKPSNVPLMISSLQSNAHPHQPSAAVTEGKAAGAEANHRLEPPIIGVEGMNPASAPNDEHLPQPADTVAASDMTTGRPPTGIPTEVYEKLKQYIQVYVHWRQQQGQQPPAPADRLLFLEQEEQVSSTVRE